MTIRMLATGVMALMISSAAISHGQEEEEKKPNPIDVAEEKAVDEDPSTVGMVEAANAARVKWDAEMKKALAKLKKAMKPEEWEALEESQTAWETYRDAEIKTQKEIYSRMEGTMWGPVAAASRKELTRQRALLLDGYAETISERE